jgi:hypothetical protein
MNLRGAAILKSEEGRKEKNDAKKLGIIRLVQKKTLSLHFKRNL